MPRVLVLANETIGGEKLLDAVRERAKQGDDVSFHVVVPQTRPRHGNVIYDDAVRDSAQVRVDLALEFMHGESITGTGEVGDGDPMNAAKDAIAEHEITRSSSPRCPRSPPAGCAATSPSACARRPACPSSTWSWTSRPRASPST